MSVRRTLRAASMLGMMSLASQMPASDHADPIDPFYFQRQEGAITDLFVFPVRKLNREERNPDKAPCRYSEVVANPYVRQQNLPLHDTQADIVRTRLSDQQRSEIESLVLILCVRRQLTDTGSLRLSPYEYRIHIDIDSPIAFPCEADSSSDHGHRWMPPEHVDNRQQGHLSVVEAFARYGGQITEPDEIREDITISFRLDDQAHLVSGQPKYSGSAASAWSNQRIQSVSGIYDDPFIFPMFFGTNIVGVAIKIPIDFFPPNKADFLIWATSHKGSKQIDHVGRSLRTQNPRFELLNTLHPSLHQQAIQSEHNHPSLMRDLLLRANFSSYFAFRRWDFVPDVMCYSTRYPAGFPNGRLLTDDVAAILAQHGDTLLYELSFQDNQYRWPRQKTNDANGGEFLPELPYLNTAFPDREQPAPPRLSASSISKLIAICIALLGLLALENWIVAKLYHRLKIKRNAKLDSGGTHE